MTATALRYLKWGFVCLFFHITIGRIDLLPDFVGVLLILQAFRSQDMTETERRMCPLLVVLAIDYFLHWIFSFSNELENLVFTVISIYVIYVLVGQVAGRIEETQPEVAVKFDTVRKGFVIVQVLNYVLGAYNITAVVMILACAMIVLLINLIVLLFRIEPVEEG